MKHLKDEMILKAEDLYFSYDDDHNHSLNGLSLEIKKGRKIAVMGANGSGKSTFFLCCTGILRPQKGRLYFQGEEYRYDKKSLLKLRSRIGIVFQDPDNQLFCASVYQEISFGILNLGVSPEKAREEVERIIDVLEITPFRHKPAHALSGGQKKQVSIADILVMHPDIIILDEPAAALDPKHTRMVNHIVEQMTEAGITVLMSTHDVNYAYEWADEVILFQEGRVLLQASPMEVFSNEEALKATNLEAPAVLSLFETLCRKGLSRCPGIWRRWSGISKKPILCNSHPISYLRRMRRNFYAKILICQGSLHRSACFPVMLRHNITGKQAGKQNLFTLQTSDRRRTAWAKLPYLRASPAYPPERAGLPWPGTPGRGNSAPAPLLPEPPPTFHPAP